MREKILEIETTIMKTSESVGWSTKKILRMLGIALRSYYRWRNGVSKPKLGYNVYSILPEEREAIVRYALQHPELRHRELAWRMVDEDVVCVSPSTVYRILVEEGLIKQWEEKKREPAGFHVVATKPDEKWQCDIAYVMINERKYYKLTFMDEYSRYVVYSDLFISMDRNTIALAAAEAISQLPAGAKPVIQTDNGGSFISRDFKSVLRDKGLTHHRIHPHTPEENGIVERVIRTLKEKLDENELNDYYSAREKLKEIRRWYNEERLHSALNYLRPVDYYRGDPKVLLAERKRKLELARQKRKELNVHRERLNMHTAYKEVHAHV